MCKPSDELLAAFAEIQQPRSRFALENFIIGQKLTTEAQYAQCVLEAQNKWDAIRLARLELEKSDIEIAAITTPGRLGEIEREKRAIEKEQTMRAMLGAERELACLCDIFESFPVQFTHEQLESAQAEEQKQRLVLQAMQDVRAQGSVSAGNQDALRMIGAELRISNTEEGAQFSVEFAKPLLGPA
jgi:hypothetical protein